MLINMLEEDFGIDKTIVKPEDEDYLRAVAEHYQNHLLVQQLAIGQAL